MGLVERKREMMRGEDIMMMVVTIQVSFCWLLSFTPFDLSSVAFTNFLCFCFLFLFFPPSWLGGWKIVGDGVIGFA